MKLYQNRIDRFSAIAKKLVDDHSAAYFKDCTQKSTNDAYNSHYNTLGKQLEQFAQDFLNNTRQQNDLLKEEVWKACNKYLELFARRNQPQQYIN